MSRKKSIGIGPRRPNRDCKCTCKHPGLINPTNLSKRCRGDQQVLRTPYTSIHLKIGTNRKQVAPPKVPNTLSVLRSLRFRMEICGEFPNEEHIFSPTLNLPFWSVPQQVGPAELYAVISRTTFFFLCTLYTTVHFQTNSHLSHNLSLSYLQFKIIPLLFPLPLSHTSLP